MWIEPGDLISINTEYGFRSLEDTHKGAQHMGVPRGQRAIALDNVLHKDGGRYYKVLVGGAGIWWIARKLISKVRLEFREKELKKIERLKQSACS